MYKITSLIFFSLFAVAAFQWIPYPFIWVFACASIVSFLLVRNSRKLETVIWFNLGSIFLVLAIFEITLEVLDAVVDERPRTTNFQLYDSDKHPDLGYVLKPGSTRRARKLYGEEVIYDVVYTVDQYGLRISPQCSDACGSSILFFGGSFTYGEGVNDRETMPYRVGYKSGGKYEIYNFGVHGYGPQHMLALIENGKVFSTVKQPPGFAIYQALYPPHISRVAGLSFWIRTGPRYILDSGGNAVRSGQFSDGGLDFLYQWSIRRHIVKSAIGKRFIYHTRKIGDQDEDLFFAVVVRSARLLKKTYPKIEFHMLYWGVPSAGLLSRLKDEDVIVHSVSNILRDRNVTGGATTINMDGHPTPMACDLIADHIFENILALPPTRRAVDIPAH